MKCSWPKEIPKIYVPNKLLGAVVTLERAYQKAGGELASKHGYGRRGKTSRLNRNSRRGDPLNPQRNWRRGEIRITRPGRYGKKSLSRVAMPVPIPAVSIMSQARL